MTFTQPTDSSGYVYDLDRKWTIAEHGLHLAETLHLSLEASLAVVRHYVAAGVIVPITDEELAEYKARTPDDYEESGCPVCGETWTAPHAHDACLAELVDDIYPDPEDTYPGAI